MEITKVVKTFIRTGWPNTFGNSSSSSSSSSPLVAQYSVY